MEVYVPTSTIAAVQSAFPAYRYRQAEFAQIVADQVGLDPAQRARLEQLYSNAGVDTRHTILPMAEYGALGGIGPANDRYIEEATDLGGQALRGALDAAGLAARDVDLLIVTSVTGVAVPSLDARLIPQLGLRADVKRLPIFGLGCVAGAAGLARLHDYLLAWPQHTAALLSLELCSLTWRPTEVTVADLVASSLFGDGAVALVATGGLPLDGRAAGGPQVVASRSQVFPDSANMLGWRLASDRFRIILTPELADVVERELSGSVTAFLAEHGLTVDEISSWICHPGGPKVIDAVQHSLKLPDSAVEMSRRSLAEAGNMSSASVLHILEKTINTCPPPAGSAGLMIGLGPGLSAELVLMQW
jgi:alkylresorcinol/alkylpyrone synthase